MDWLICEQYQVLRHVHSNDGHLLIVLADHLLDDVGQVIILRLFDDVEQLLHHGSNVGPDVDFSYRGIGRIMKTVKNNIFNNVSLIITCSKHNQALLTLFLTVFSIQLNLIELIGNQNYHLKKYLLCHCIYILISIQKLHFQFHKWTTWIQDTVLEPLCILVNTDNKKGMGVVHLND